MLAIAAALALLVASVATAAPGGPSGDGVQPTERTGNPNCVDLLGAGAKEAKQDPPKDGTLTSGAFSVTIDVKNSAAGQVFDFSGATKPVGMVIVKGGPPSNIYSYPGGDTADTALHAPINPSTGEYYELSHITFCFDVPLGCTAANVTADPVGVTTTYGDGNVSFTASATGNPAPTVQWQLSTLGAGGPWSDIPGETDTTLTIADPPVSTSGNRYRAVFTNICGGVQTDTTLNALLVVNPKAVPGAFTAANKVYDGNTSATITGRSITSGVVAGDDVTLVGGSATFNNKNVGDGKPVTGTGFSLGGADAANYTLSGVANTTANITPKPLTGTCTVADKVYDGGTSASVTGSSLGAGVVAGDVVSLNDASRSSAFGDPDVGNDKPTPCNGYALAGADSGNYTLAMSPTTADITPKALTGTCTVANKVYDGTTGATVTGGSLGAGVVAGDSVGLSSSGASSAFGNPDVGNGKATPCNGFALSGADAKNYTLTMSPTTANITPKPVTANCAAADKDFDGNTSATLTGFGLVGVVSGDTVSLTGGSAAFGTPDPGNNKFVQCSGFTLTGADAGNYTLVDQPTTKADIRRPPAESPKPTCLRRKLFAFIRGGKQTKRVVFFLDGKKLKNVTKRDSHNRFGVRVDRAKLSIGTHKISAKVFFTKASKRKPIRLIVVKFKTCLGGGASKAISVSAGGKGKCVSKSFIAFVKGDTISKVTFILNGRKLRTRKVADGQGRYKVQVRPSQLKAGKNVLKAKMVFISGSETKSKTLKRTFKPC